MNYGKNIFGLLFMPHSVNCSRTEFTENRTKQFFPFSYFYHFLIFTIRVCFLFCFYSNIIEGGNGLAVGSLTQRETQIY
jgi:hypothetical protein